MTLDPLSVHEHFRCNRSAFEGLEHYYKPRVEVEVNPHIDWNDFAGVEDLERLFKPRIDNAGRIASEWERHLLNECLRMGVWRIWFVQWCEYTETAAFMNTKVFPPWGFKEAQALAKKVGEHIVGLSFKKFLLMGDDEFVRESRSSPNMDVMLEMRRVMSKRCQRKCK
jgi:hypothetical protein